MTPDRPKPNGSGFDPLGPGKLPIVEIDSEGDIPRVLREQFGITTFNPINFVPEGFKPIMPMQEPGIQVKKEQSSLDINPEIQQAYVAAITSPKKDRRARNLLIRNVVKGDNSDDFLDLVHLSVKNFVVNRKQGKFSKPVPESLPLTRESREATKDFLVEFSNALSEEGKALKFDLRSEATYSKFVLVDKTLSELDELPQAEIKSLPFGLRNLKEGFKHTSQSGGPKKDVRFSFLIPPELNSQEFSRLREINQADISSLTQSEFNLVAKALFHYHREPLQIAKSVMVRLISQTTPEQLSKTLHFINEGYASQNPVVKHRLDHYLTSILQGPDNIETETAKAQWFGAIQGELMKFVIGPEADPEVIEELERLVLQASQGTESFDLYQNLTVDYQSYIDNLNSGQIYHDFAPTNVGLAAAILTSRVNSTAVDLLARHLNERSRANMSILSMKEMFSPDRPLGFFMDNLSVHWQELQQITREQMWPSFITKRQAKLWPSERELDVLQFVDKHPAAVLGFKDISFSTRGYQPPEVGLQFRFKDKEGLVFGKLDKNGHLTGLTVDLSDKPEVQAFLEHIAVGSFQELVTIASKKITPRQEKDVMTEIERKKQQNIATEGKIVPAMLLPRSEVTYISLLTEYHQKTLTSDQVIEEAGKREGMPKQIPQKVVPLAYAQVYRHYRDELAAARQNNDSEIKIKILEGQAAEALSYVTKPSGSKLDSLPEEFALEKTPDGKYLDTWRRVSYRPKLKKGEEDLLPVVFEKQFRAAPIALSTHLSTWFTQPVAA